jgi:hypothetical protein
MLKSSSLCLYSSNLGTFWLKIKQFWPFEEISIFSNGSRPIMQIRKKGGWNLEKNLLLWKYWVNLNQTLLKWFLGGPLPKLCPWFLRRKFLCEFPIGSYVKLSSAVVAILVGVLKCRTQFWKRTTQESFIYYGIFYELWTFADFDRLCKLEKRGDEI